MRLTLRTLLALRDEVLLPDDAAHLQDQVNKSPFAKKIIERIDAGLADSSLPSPAVDGRGFQRDPNTIAEYLENTLSEDKIPEIEKICLEQDSYLIEMAACHEILSRSKLESDSPAEAFRSRLIDLPNHPRSKSKNRGAGAKKRKSRKSTGTHSSNTPPGMDTQHGSDGSNARSSHSSVERRIDNGHTQLRSPHFERDLDEPSLIRDVEQGTLGTQQPSSDSRVANQPETIRTPGIDLTDQSVSQQVPEYLRGRSTGNWKSAALTGALIVMLVVVGWQAIGSLSNVRSLWNADRVATNNENPASGTSNDSKISNPATPNLNAPSPNASIEKTPTVDIEAEELGQLTPNPIGSDRQPSAEPDSTAEKPAPTPTPDSELSPNTSAIIDLAGPGRSGEDETIDLSPPPASDTLDQPDASQPSEPAGIWLPLDELASKSIVVSIVQNSIQRVRPGDNIESGQTILTAPYSTTQFQLGAGLSLESFNGARFTPLDSRGPDGGVAEEGEADAASLRVEYGVVVASSTADCKQIYLQHGNNICHIKFEAPNGSVAVRATQVATFNEADQGFDYDDILTIIPLSGEGTWQEISSDGSSSGELNSLELGTRIGWVKDQPVAIFDLDAIPGWLRSPPPRRIDMRATKELFERVSNVTPQEFGQEIATLVSYRRRETASLAARLQIQMGIFDQLFGSDGLIQRRGMRAYWDGIVQDLIVLSSRDRQMRQRCLAALESAYGKTPSEKIGMLLCFITPEQLENGFDRTLVDSLGSDILLERILANWQLQRITGRDMGFAADMSDDESIRGWRRLLSKSQIRYSADPYPFDL